MKAACRMTVMLSKLIGATWQYPKMVDVLNATAAAAYTASPLVGKGSVIVSMRPASNNILQQERVTCLYFKAYYTTSKWVKEEEEEEVQILKGVSECSFICFILPCFLQ